MMRWIRWTPRRLVVAGVLALSLATFSTWILWPDAGAEKTSHASTKPSVAGTARAIASGGAGVRRVVLDREQQRAIGLSTQPVTFGFASIRLSAPGQIIPDETKFAHITPRAAGVVRMVAAREGQQVKAGDLLATVDSPDVAQARFDLTTATQEYEVARNQASWQETIYANTVALLERLEAGDTPDEIQKKFEDRPVGTNREQLIGAYANQRLARATYERKTSLHEQKILSIEVYQQARAAYESAQAAYTSLFERMEFTARLENTRAQQSLRRAETALNVARERLHVLGVRHHGTEPPVWDGKVVGVKPEVGVEADALSQPERARSASAGSESTPQTLPASTYSIWAPIDGTILDRLAIVPGVHVDTTHRIFTLADLSTVWVEVSVHESDYGSLRHSKDAEVRFNSPAYRGETFTAEILYKGDLVDTKSRRLKLLARARNEDRLLKPGMFVDVEIRIPSAHPVALVPASAVVSDDDDQLVYVRIDPESFERRIVEIGTELDGRVEVLAGLEAGEEVVTSGASKLEPKSVRDSTSETTDANDAKVVAR